MLVHLDISNGNAIKFRQSMLLKQIQFVLSELFRLFQQTDFKLLLKLLALHDLTLQVLHVWMDIWIYRYTDSYILVKNKLCIILNEIEIHSIKYHISQTLNRLYNNVPNTPKIPHLNIAHQEGNLQVGNLDIQGYQDCPPYLSHVFVLKAYLGSVFRPQNVFPRLFISN